MAHMHINGRPRFDARYGVTLAAAAALAAGAGLAGGVAQHLDGRAGKIAIAGAVAAAAAALSLTVSAMKTWSAARRPPGRPARPVALDPARPLITHMALLALPAPPKANTAHSEDAGAQPKAEKPKPEPHAPVDAERARLQAAGFSEAEISQILVAREAGGGARSGFGTGTTTGLLNNIDAILTFARACLPSFKADLERMFDADRDRAVRVGGALSFMVKLAALGVFGYFLYIEAIEFRARAYKTWSEACIERQKNAINHSSIADLMSGRKLDGDDDCASQ